MIIQIEELKEKYQKRIKIIEKENQYKEIMLHEALLEKCKIIELEKEAQQRLFDIKKTFGNL